MGKFFIPYVIAMGCLFFALETTNCPESQKLVVKERRVESKVVNIQKCVDKTGKENEAKESH